VFDQNNYREKSRPLNGILDTIIEDDNVKSTNQGGSPMKKNMSAMNFS
jgi:hypothetical protein